MRDPKIKIRELSAGEITQEAIKILTERGCKVWRQNNLRTPGRAFIGLKGVPDVIGFHKKTGVMVGCETKKNGDTIKPDQVLFMSELKAAGGLAMIARQVGDKVELINY